MTDSRFPERWLNDRRFALLSAEAFRLFVVANTWAASNRTDGAISRQDLALFPRWVDIGRADELVSAGLWLAVPGGWQIAGFVSHQTTAAQLDAAEHARAMGRQRKARQRARERVSADSGDVPRDVPREDTGQARTGQEEKEANYGRERGVTDEPAPDPVVAQLPSRDPVRNGTPSNYRYPSLRDKGARVRVERGYDN